MKDPAAIENTSTQEDEAGAAPFPRQASQAAWRRIGLEWWCLLALVAAAFLIRLWGMSKMHFWDENVYLLNADYFFSGRAGYTEIDSRPPLLPLFFAGAFHVWYSDYAAEIVAAMLNAVGPLFLYLAGRRIVGRSAAAIAALLLAFGPFLVGVCPDGHGALIPNCNGHSLLTDCPALTLVVFSLWLGVRALEKQTSLRFAVFGFAMAAAFLMRYGSMSSVGILALMTLGAKARARAVIACAAGFFLGMAPYFCWSRYQFGAFFEALRQGWLNFGGDEEPFGYYLKILPEVISWLAVSGLALWFVRRGRELWRRKKQGELTAGVGAAIRSLRWEVYLWFWAAAVLVFFSSLGHKEPRYAIPLAPPLLLLAGVGLGTLLVGAGKAMKAAGGVALACALMVTFWPSHHRFDGGFIDHSVSDEMIVSEYLKANLPSSTVLYANLNYPDFAYYSGLTVRDLPESGSELYAELDRLPVGSVLIAYKAAGDNDESPAEPPLSFLDSNPRFTRIREFPTLVVYRRIAL